MRNASDSATIWNNGDDDVDDDDDDDDDGDDGDDVDDDVDDDVLPSERRSLIKLFQQKLYHLFNVDAAIVVCVS